MPHMPSGSYRAHLGPMPSSRAHLGHMPSGSYRAHLGPLARRRAVGRGDVGRADEGQEHGKEHEALHGAEDHDAKEHLSYGEGARLLGQMLYLPLAMGREHARWRSLREVRQVRAGRVVA